MKEKPWKPFHSFLLFLFLSLNKLIQAHGGALTIKHKLETFEVNDMTYYFPERAMKSWDWIQIKPFGPCCWQFNEEPYFRG